MSRIPRASGSRQSCTYSSSFVNANNTTSRNSGCRTSCSGKIAPTPSRAGEPNATCKKASRHQRAHTSPSRMSSMYGDPDNYQHEAAPSIHAYNEAEGYGEAYSRIPVSRRPGSAPTHRAKPKVLMQKEQSSDTSLSPCRGTHVKTKKHARKEIIVPEVVPPKTVYYPPPTRCPARELRPGSSHKHHPQHRRVNTDGSRRSLHRSPTPTQMRQSPSRGPFPGQGSSEFPCTQVYPDSSGESFEKYEMEPCNQQTCPRPGSRRSNRSQRDQSGRQSGPSPRRHEVDQQWCQQERRPPCLTPSSDAVGTCRRQVSCHARTCPDSERSGSSSQGGLGATVPSYMDSSHLQHTMYHELMNKSAMNENVPIRVKGSTRGVPAELPYVRTARGMVPVEKQFVLEERLERSTKQDHLTRHLTDITPVSCGKAKKMELSIQELKKGSLHPHGSFPRETLDVTTTISVLPGKIQSTKKTVATTTRTGLDEDEVAALVDDEHRDTEDAAQQRLPELKAPDVGNYPLQKKLHLALASPDEMKLLQQSLAPVGPTDEAEEDVQPEVVAALMHTEEKGLRMGLAPTQLYKYLFPEHEYEQTIGISSAAPAPLQDIVVPTSVPSELHRSYLNAELQQAALATQVTLQKPVDSIFSESVLGKGDLPKLSNVATRSPCRKYRKKRKGGDEYEPLIAELPPWGQDDMQVPVDLQPMIDLVGAHPNNTLIASEYCYDQEKLFPSADKGLEYILKPQPPRHVSRVQLRGSTSPCWFQGYVVALPTYQDVVKVMRSPDSILPSAWNAVQPSMYPEDSMF